MHYPHYHALHSHRVQLTSKHYIHVVNSFNPVECGCHFFLTDAFVSYSQQAEHTGLGRQEKNEATAVQHQPENSSPFILPLRKLCIHVNWIKEVNSVSG